jgi:hypothetical protein
MSTPDRPIEQTTAVGGPTTRPPLANAYRVAIVAAATFVITFLIGFIPLADSSGETCGSAFKPGPETIIDDQTAECLFRVSAQQQLVYPLLIVSGAVAAAGVSWNVRRP